MVKSFYSFLRYERAVVFYKSYLELNGPDQSRFLCIGSLLGYGFMLN